MQTARGIELDINKTKYKYRIYGYIFYFSSQFYLNKFKNTVEDYITYQNSRLFIKYQIHCKFYKYLAISYYKKIEKRGFLIEDEKTGEKIKYIDEIELEY